MQQWTKETLREGRPGWAKLHPITIEAKGSTKPMIDSEQMVEGIEVFDFGRMAKEVGWSRGKPRSDGRDHDAVASALENGASIEVTPAIRGYFAAMGFPLKATTQVLTIPARPFLEPTFDAHLMDLVEIGKKFLQDMVDFLIK